MSGIWWLILGAVLAVWLMNRHEARKRERARQYKDFQIKKLAADVFDALGPNVTPGPNHQAVVRAAEAGDFPPSEQAFVTNRIAAQVAEFVRSPALREIHRMEMHRAMLGTDGQ